MRDELRQLSPFLVPELKLWLLPPDAPSWHATPDTHGMPYWAFAWPGGQVLARYVLDHPDVVRGKRVLDFGSGCAVEGIAAMVAGAARVLCADIDATANEFALKNFELSAALTPTLSRERERGNAGFSTCEEDLLERAPPDVDLILVGDACYSPELAARLLPWLRSSRAEVLIGDPLRVPGMLDDAQVLATYDASFDGDPRGLTRWPTHVLRLK